MSLDPLTTLTKVEQFLRTEVSQKVAPELRSEVKAAAKLLNESIREIDQLANRLYEECQAMAALCQRVILQFHSTPIEAEDVLDFTAWHTLSLSAQIEYHKQVLQHFDHMLIALADGVQYANKQDEGLAVLLTECIALQAQFSQQKLAFQSVFKQL